MKLRLHIRSMTMYIFAGSVLYLAAAYLAGPFAYLAAVLAIAAGMNLIHIVRCLRSLSVRPYRLSPTYTRGDTLRVGYTILNSGLLSFPGLDAAVFVSGPLEEGDEADAVCADRTMRVSVWSSGIRTVEEQLSLQHRGRYRISRGPVVYRDVLGWVTVSFRLADEYIDVLPRADTPVPAIQNVQGYGGAEMSAFGRSPDFSMLRGLLEYREGMPARHIAWRRMAATGIPYIRDFEPGADPELAIFLDTRRGWADREQVLSSEDTLVEVFLRLLADLQSAHIPFRGRTVPDGEFRLDSGTPLDLASLHHASRTIRFADGPRPTAQIRTMLHGAPATAAEVVVLTQMPDSELFQQAWTVIGVTTAWSAGQIHTIRQTSDDTRVLLL